MTVNLGVSRFAPRSRMARLRATHSYRSVLAIVFVTFVFVALAGDAPWTTSVLVLLGCAMLVTAVWTSGLARAGSKMLMGLVAASTVIAVYIVFSSGHNLIGVAAILSAVLVVLTAVAIAVGVLDQGTINVQSVTGAICIYLLLGMIFLFMYGSIAAFGSGSFFAQGTDGTRSLRLYFSYVTLATLGYGDYTPAGNLGHMLAITEALLGQLYLVTVVAILVARLGHQRSAQE